MLWPKHNCLLIDPADGLTDANRWKESSVVLIERVA